MSRPLRLLSIGHSYVVGLNRRLTREIALAGSPRWEITVAAPAYYSGKNDLRPVQLERLPGEPYRLVKLRTHLGSRVRVFFYAPFLRRLLRGERWDFIHCWEEPYIVAGGQVGCWTPSRVPLVFYTMQNVVKRYPPPFSWLEQFSLRRAAGWIAVGETTRQAQLRRGYGVRPGRVIPLGVALDHFRPDPAARAACRRQLGWGADGPPVVGFLGRFALEKGLAVLTAALDGLTCGWRALFVGGGPQEGELRRWAARHGDCVRVVPPVRHSDVPPYLNAMDLLCAPSQTQAHWREQQGRMLIEAFACGVPVIGSDSGDIPHVVADGGVVCPEGEVNGWRDAIGRLIDAPSQRVGYIKKGLDRAHSIYAWPIIAKQHLVFFEELLDSRPAAS
jgi:glycosyltransferase involved in cell wall biosynthesis